MLHRGLDSATYYWMCTFANNQHDLSELEGGLMDTPFVKAILTGRQTKVGAWGEGYIDQGEGIGIGEG